MRSMREICIVLHSSSPRSPPAAMASFPTTSPSAPNRRARTAPSVASGSTSAWTDRPPRATSATAALAPMRRCPVVDEPPGPRLLRPAAKLITTSFGRFDGDVVRVRRHRGWSTSTAVAEPAGAHCAERWDLVVERRRHVVRLQRQQRSERDGHAGGSGSVSGRRRRAADRDQYARRRAAAAQTVKTANGEDGQSVTLTAEPPGGNCARRWPSRSGRRNGPTAYVCNGAAGQSVDVSTVPAGAHCADGGVALQVGSGAPTYVCDGAQGAQGDSVTMTAEPPGAYCPTGGMAGCRSAAGRRPTSATASTAPTVRA